MDIIKRITAVMLISTAAPGFAQCIFSDGFEAPCGRNYSASNQLLDIEHSAIKSRAIENLDLISATLADQENNNPITTPVPLNNYLGDQLKMAVRLIAIRGSIGTCRQTFFVRLSGWETHSNQLQEFPPLVQTLSNAIGAFYDTTVELGAANSVSTFTMSEFCRTVNSNGEGTDHGWGGHQFVVGGAVNGSQIIGDMPNLTLEGPDDVERGRNIPALAIEQYASTLASWFGVSNTDMNTVSPNLGEFGFSNLGFMA